MPCFYLQVVQDHLVLVVGVVAVASLQVNQSVIDACDCAKRNVLVASLA